MKKERVVAKPVMALSDAGGASSGSDEEDDADMAVAVKASRVRYATTDTTHTHTHHPHTILKPQLMPLYRTMKPRPTVAPR